MVEILARHEGLKIRRELPQDQGAIFALTELAFRDMPYAGGDEQEVIERLRDRGELALSLVAEQKGEIVGQITFSRALVADGSGPWFALGPVSVLPSHQGMGIGAALIERGLAEIRALDARGCILTGNPDYYRRFGFESSPANAPVNEPAEFFMLKLFAGQTPDGVFVFQESFYR